MRCWALKLTANCELDLLLGCEAASLLLGCSMAMLLRRCVAGRRCVAAGRGMLVKLGSVAATTLRACRMAGVLSCCAAVWAGLARGGAKVAVQAACLSSPQLDIL